MHLFGLKQARGAPSIMDGDDYFSDPDLFDLDSDEENRSKAEEMEGVLGDALNLAEQRTGSLLSLQRAPRHEAVDLGRRLSSFTNTTERDGVAINDDGSIRTSHSKESQITFIKVAKGDPTILAQQSWESIMSMSGQSTVNSNSNRSAQNGGGTIGKSTIPREVEAPPIQPRKWDKLRYTLEAEEEQKRGPFRLKKLFRRNKNRQLGEYEDPENMVNRQNSDNDNTNNINEKTTKNPSRRGKQKNRRSKKFEKREAPPSFASDDFAPGDFVPDDASTELDADAELSSSECQEEPKQTRNPSRKEAKATKAERLAAKVPTEILKEAASLEEGLPLEDTVPLEEAESLEVVFSDAHGSVDILPPFPSRLAAGL